ncbi:Sphingolipid C4-hydroxylase sur2 [Xanthoria parietina]
MANQTTYEPPCLPSYTLKPVPQLVPWLSDFHLSLVLPVAAYWFVSLIFWYIDKKDYWSQYRIHTPEEFKQRNRVTVGEVLRSILLQQAVQTALGLCLGYLTDAGDFQGRQDYDIVIWAGRVHRARDAVPWTLALLGVDAKTLVSNIQTYAATMALTAPSTEKPLVLLSSLVYPHVGEGLTYGFTSWEIWVAKTIYWILEPAARFGLAVFFSDSWQYFWHRAMHTNKWMFRNIHAHHHKIYVPYAFGAFYNTLTEAFLLDTVGTTLSLMLSGLTIRQTMFFSTISVMKGVDDHCGYRLPWDPLQWGNEQNTAFHDVHHQSWGIKSNYSQLYTTFWDHFCNTVCRKSEAEIALLYEKGRVLARQRGEVEGVMEGEK